MANSQSTSHGPRPEEIQITITGEAADVEIETLLPILENIKQYLLAKNLNCGESVMTRPASQSIPEQARFTVFNTAVDELFEDLRQALTAARYVLSSDNGDDEFIDAEEADDGSIDLQASFWLNISPSQDWSQWQRLNLAPQK